MQSTYHIARVLSQALLACTEDDLVSLVRAEDTELAGVLAGRQWLSLADADRAAALERTTEKRLAAWARQMLNLPVPGAPIAAQTAVEVEWHPTYRGGDWDEMGELTLIVVPGALAMPAGVTDALVDAAFQAQTGYDPACIIRWQDTSDDPAWANYYDPAGELRKAALSNGRP